MDPATASPRCHRSAEEEEEGDVTSPLCHPAGSQHEEVAAAVTATTSLRCHPGDNEEEEEEEEVTAVTSQGGPCGRDEDVVAAGTAGTATTSPGCQPGEEEVTAAVTSPECHPEEEEVTAAVTSPVSHPGEEEEEVTAAVTSPVCHPAEEEEEVTAAVTSPVSHPGEEEEEVTAAVTAAVATSVPGGRRGADEDVAAAGWRARRKHVFVLSEAGKPIYSRHGNEEALAATMGVMMALVSFIQSGGNAIRAICSGTGPEGLRVGLGPLPRGGTPPQVYTATPPGVARHRYSRACSPSLPQNRLARVNSPGRPARVQTAPRKWCCPPSRSLGRGPDAPPKNSRLATVRLCASDLHLLLNLLGGGVGAGEVWTPVCLPRFNPDGYFYAYAARLGEEEEEEGEEGVTLILLSTEREGFYAAAACRRQLEETLRAQGWLAELAAAVRGGAGYGPARPGAPELRHFLYKPLEGPEEMQQLPQFTSPELEEPYSSEEEQQRLFDLYHYLHGRVHSPQRPLRLLYHVAEKETLLAWVRRGQGALTGARGQQRGVGMWPGGSGVGGCRWLVAPSLEPAVN
ncbi:vacuolar fusion protein MON1 homolog B-like [Parus major]|uniref:vacuolar fusion protein MON1 homolog B-like n=1 Tax=Parus major TaxID=9157 RepID=UPI00077133AE|nr:vacuolar fusion protein MON1 homolog B-like [Parus major]